MKMIWFKHGLSLIYISGTLVLVLLFAVSFLYYQNTSIQNQNRTLILENDSILSENIRLKNSLLDKQVRQATRKNNLSAFTTQ